MGRFHILVNLAPLSLCVKIEGSRPHSLLLLKPHNPHYDLINILNRRIYSIPRIPWERSAETFFSILSFTSEVAK